MTTETYTAGFLFCGLGAGARGFLEARAADGHRRARFVSVGGIDNDPAACRDFSYLTGSPATCADLGAMQPSDLRTLWGDRRPDVIFSSPPCKGMSGLLSGSQANTPKYQEMNSLVLKALFLSLETWPEDRPPLVLLENVPRIRSRGAVFLGQIKQLLVAYGYALDDTTHDCGELGGLAQHRKRYLLIARRREALKTFVYRPAKKRVRGVGEVLSKMFMPEDERAGDMHRLNRLSWKSWLRLALIPAGGDWRDLPGVVPAGQERRSVWARNDLRRWTDPARTVAGAGSNGGYGVADPRVLEALQIRCATRPNLYGIVGWDEAMKTVTGSASVSGSNGVAAVADPRVEEVRLQCAPRAGSYGVLRWEGPSPTVIGSARWDNSSSSVADPRIGNIDTPVRDHVPVIVSDDQTWHRPLTTLELAALQSLPVEVGGSPLRLDGAAQGKWRERIGNAVPVDAAHAIATEMLQAFLASGSAIQPLPFTDVWVRPTPEAKFLSPLGAQEL